MPKKVAGTGVPRSAQITATRDYRAQQQTKILHVDCRTSGLLVSCRTGSRPEDQKTRKPSYRYWSAVHVEVLILLVVANVQINKWNWFPPRLRRGVGYAENTILILFSCAHNPSSADNAMSFSSLG